MLDFGVGRKFVGPRGVEAADGVGHFGGALNVVRELAEVGALFGFGFGAGAGLPGGGGLLEAFALPEGFNDDGRAAEDAFAGGGRGRDGGADTMAPL